MQTARLGVTQLRSVAPLPTNTHTRSVTQWNLSRRNCVLSVSFLFIVCANCPSQERNVRFIVVIPLSTPKEARICIAGNQNALGDWNPGKIVLTKKSDSTWVGQFRFEKGAQLEYKITRGGWNVQAVYDNGTIPGNSRLTVGQDTEIVIRPKSWSDIAVKMAGGIVGAVKYHRGLTGEGLDYARDLIVWLPPSYKKDTTRHYPVLYVHDGQNIIDPSTSFIGYDWRVDEVADSLIRAGKMKEIIVVGIYNSPDRMVEYSDTVRGRAYAKFIVQKVKTLVDSSYRTLPDRLNTAVMGSSMGGLISFLITWWYPDVFSMAGCLSSVFSFDHDKLLKQVKAEKGHTRDIRIYMDCGGYAGESTLKSGMDTMIELLKEKGYREGSDFESFYDPPAEHSERAWAARIWRPLLFFFGNRE